jgi:hypothetical protein
MRSRLLHAFVIAAGIVLIGGAAVASVPDPSGVIHSCRKMSTGEVRVIDSATQTCPAGTTALNWSQTGPAGPPGAQGPAGPSGVSGYEVVGTSVPLIEAAPGLWTNTADAVCPAGKTVLSGGGGVGNNPEAWISSSQIAAADRWQIHGSAKVPGTLNVSAVCAFVQ